MIAVWCILMEPYDPKLSRIIQILLILFVLCKFCLKVLIVVWCYKTFDYRKLKWKKIQSVAFAFDIRVQSSVVFFRANIILGVSKGKTCWKKTCILNLKKDQRKLIAQCSNILRTRKNDYTSGSVTKMSFFKKENDNFLFINKVFFTLN